MNAMDFAEWQYWKVKEQEATDRRRAIEDKLTEALKIDATVDASKTYKPVDGWKVKVTTRLNHRVNGDELQTIAHEFGLGDHLPTLFRWKPEINAKAWKNAAAEITGPLSKAITTTASRPSFKIEQE